MASRVLELGEMVHTTVDFMRDGKRWTGSYAFSLEARGRDVFPRLMVREHCLEDDNLAVSSG